MGGGRAYIVNSSSKFYAGYTPIKIFQALLPCRGTITRSPNLWPLPQTVAELLAQGDLDAFICDGATDLEEEEGSDSDPGGNSDDGILW